MVQEPVRRPVDFFILQKLRKRLRQAAFAAEIHAYNLLVLKDFQQ